MLNLAWLLLGLPAYMLWRNSRAARNRHDFTSLQCLLALGCALLMLFPVISATDDLHAMRAEIEEAPATKRSVRASSIDKASTWNTRLQSPPAVLGATTQFFLVAERAEPQSISLLPVPAGPPAVRASRAPPSMRPL